MTPKECHKRFGKWQETLIKRFQGGLSTHSISDEDGDKVKGVVVAKAGAGKPYTLLDGLKLAQMPQDVSERSSLLEYIIMPLSLIVWLVEAIREAVSHLLLSNRPSRASFWPVALQ